MKCLLFTAAFETTVDLFLMNVQLEHTAVRSPGSCLLPSSSASRGQGQRSPLPLQRQDLPWGLAHLRLSVDIF